MIYMVMITNPKLIKEKPALVKRFVAATREGFYYSLLNIDEAVGFMEKRYPEVIPMKYRVSYKEAEYYAREFQHDPIGLTYLSNWQGMKDELTSIKFIDGTVDPKKCFTNQFISGNLRGK
jgi:ABC-type nitrate/sulfonate/bicarbonate transport system substrate-binding protein